MVVVVDATHASAVADALREQGETVYAIGEITARTDDAPQVTVA